MTLSSFTGLPGDIADPSDATPGLFNVRFSRLSQNLDQLNSDASDLSTRVDTIETSENTAAGWNKGSITTTLDTSAGTFSVLTIRPASGAQIRWQGADLNISSGDVVFITNNKGLIMKDNGGTNRRVMQPASNKATLEVNTGGYDEVGVVTGRLYVSGATFGIQTSHTPATGTSSGTTGDVVWDSDYVYVCTSTDSWKRASLSAF